MVLNPEDYDEKVKDVIDKPPFQKVKKDPTKTIEEKLNKHLWQLHQQGDVKLDR